MHYKCDVHLDWPYILDILICCIGPQGRSRVCIHFIFTNCYYCSMPWSCSWWISYNEISRKLQKRQCVSPMFLRLFDICSNMHPMPLPRWLSCVYNRFVGCCIHVRVHWANNDGHHSVISDRDRETSCKLHLNFARNALWNVSSPLHIQFGIWIDLEPRWLRCKHQ